MSEVDRRSAAGTRDLWDGSQMQDLETCLKLTGTPLEEGNNTAERGRGLDIVTPEPQTRVPSLASPHLIPAPDSPNPSTQIHPSPSLSVRLPPPVPSFGRQCAASQAPLVDHSQYDHLSPKRLRKLCMQKGYCRKDSKKMLETRLAVMGAEHNRRS